jgi:acylphosphatase
MPKSLRCLVSGRVQGVAFRAFVREQATGFGLTGWVRNLPGGQVEVLAQGPDQALDEFAVRLRRGPFLARVDAVDAAFTEHDEVYRDFQIKR